MYKVQELYCIYGMLVAQRRSAMVKQGPGRVPRPVDGTVAKLVQILPEKKIKGKSH